MSSCEKCSEQLEVRNFDGKSVQYCYSCKSYFGLEVLVTEKKIPRQREKKTVKCPYCVHLFRDLINLRYYYDQHMTDSHPVEYDMERTNTLVQFKNVLNRNHWLATIALEFVESEDILLEIIIQSSDWQIKLNALNKIKEHAILDILLDKTKEDRIKVAVQTRLTQFKLK
ncbi:MAG: hypothetical protein INQ03_13895 [Candidatus Heimdallarchaeota archaeon]|nr:hypothetical protein [Candidatus Heimdallarchaeota archaeon]